jgi:hypothetical protein
MPLGVLTLDDGEVINVSYVLWESISRNSTNIRGSIANLDVATALRLVGMSATLKLDDGRRLRIVFKRPSQFVGTGSYF